jgi:lipoprotein signal peptidase
MRVRLRRVGVLFAVAGTALTLDILSKIAVVAELEHREPIRLLSGLLTLTVSRNSGAAFSIGTGMTIVFTVIAVGVIVAILRTARRLASLPWAISLGLLLGGATGNLVDRIVRSPAPFQGHVVDWIELPHWPVFNLADSAIVCGGALAVLLAARGLQIDGSRVHPQRAGTNGPARPAASHQPPAQSTAQSMAPPPASAAQSAAPPRADAENGHEAPGRSQPDAEPGARS